MFDLERIETVSTTGLWTDSHLNGISYRLFKTFQMRTATLMNEDISGTNTQYLIF